MKRKLALFLVLIAALFALTACSSQKEETTVATTPEGIYTQAQTLLSQGEFARAAEKFESLGSYEEAATLTIYCKACALCESGDFETGIEELKKMGDYKDAAMRVDYYTARSYDDANVGTTDYEQMERAKEIYSKNKLYLDSMERMAALDTRIAQAKETLYNEAIAARANGNYDDALKTFRRISGYRDAEDQINASYYEKGKALQAAGDYEGAINAFEAAGNYSDAETQIKETRYQQATALMAGNDYAGAYEIFKNITDYKDVTDLLANNEKLVKIAYEVEYAVGNTITFGTYPQTAAGGDKTPIEWIVLAKDGDKALLISKYALDCRQYHTYWTDNTWEKCSLRSWLNDNFLNSAFSKEEQAYILTTNVTADKNPSYSTNPGNDTQDKVFLLSIPEAETYFKNNASRQCQPTAYAVKQGAWQSTDSSTKGNCRWWLRSPGSSQVSAAYVINDGSVYHNGSIVRFDDYAVRPALWVNLDSGIF